MESAQIWFSFYKCLLRSGSLLLSLNLKCPVQVFLYSLVHYSAAENIPTVTGLALCFFGVCFWCFYNLGLIFNQLDFSLSLVKEAEENPKHHFCDLCRWKWINESCMPKVVEREKGWQPWLPHTYKKIRMSSKEVLSVSQSNHRKRWQSLYQCKLLFTHMNSSSFSKEKEMAGKRDHHSWFQHESSWWDVSPGFSIDSPALAKPMRCPGSWEHCLDLGGYLFMGRFPHPKDGFLTFSVY